MANLNSDQYGTNKRERNLEPAHIVAKSYPLWLAVGMIRYGSLININPSDSSIEQMMPVSFFWLE